MRFTISKIAGIVTRVSDEDMPDSGMLDILNMHLNAHNELEVRLGGAKVNTTRLGYGPGMGIAQFVPKRERTM